MDDGSEAFTHTARQYLDRGFIRLPEVKKTMLVFRYIPGEAELEGLYKGRFVELPLNHVHRNYIKIIALPPL